MAKVSLRSYNREIEGFIDQNRLDEAIAHSRHILQTYPKHLDTYRLLGKAFLEAKQYDEAVDVFTRVLSSVPDDFVSHVGMSIIRDEQGRLDDAISHMERAFETQPSNAAIQNELRRLFGRRDGMQPTKIRMNRGALAHMYVQGELYPQAISEIRAVLAADSQRMDMRTLLARAYFHAGQKADASDACAQLLETHPYSLDANRIMAELTQGTGSQEVSAVYRDRVIELDPYAAHSPGSVFRSSEAPEVAVSLEHLEFRGPDMEPAPEWKPAGIGEPAPDSQPEWLKKDYPASEESPAPRLESGKELPEFMRAAGWTATTGAIEEPAPPAFGAEETEQTDLAPGDMPEWLKAMAPQEEPEEPPVVPAPPIAPLQGAEIPDWLSDATPRDAEAAVPMQAAEPAADLPEWLREMKSEGAGTPAAEVPAAPVDEPAAWMADMTLGEVEADSIPTREPAASSVDDTPDWLKTISAEAEEPAQDIPDWLKNIEATEPGLAPSSAEASLPDWLEPTVEEAAPAPSMRAPEPLETEFPPKITPVEPLTPPPSLESLGTSAKEQDDALAWLESLAAKHGARAEEMVSDPNARTDKPPEWVEQAKALNEGQPGTPEPATDATQPIFLEPEPDEKVEQAVEPVEAESPYMETPEPVAPELEGSIRFDEVGEARVIEPEAEQPESLEYMVEPPAGEEEPILEPFVPGAGTPAADETGIWLRSLDQKETVSEAGSEAITAEFIESIEQAETWTKSPEETVPPIAEAAKTPVEETSDLPDWLQDIDREEEAWSAAPIAETLDEDIPAWLQGETEAEAEAEPTAPGDWQPAEARLEPEAPEAEAAPAPEKREEEIPSWLEKEAEAAGETEPEISAAPVGMEAELEAPQELRVEPEDAPTPEQREEKIPFWLRREPIPADDAEPLIPAQAEAPQEPEAERMAPVEMETVEPEPEVQPEAQPEAEAEAEAPHVEEPGPELQPAEAAPTPVKLPARRAERPERRPAGAASPVGEPVLTLARAEMNRGSIPTALDQYRRLIKRGKYLEETIHDMREALYRYPVEVSIWQTLGDAYMRENRLQEALDAYTKAEELLR